jgi:hypothetical protein
MLLARFVCQVKKGQDRVKSRSNFGSTHGGAGRDEGRRYLYSRPFSLGVRIAIGYHVKCSFRCSLPFA